MARAVADGSGGRRRSGAARPSSAEAQKEDSTIGFDDLEESELGGEADEGTAAGSVDARDRAELAAIAAADRAWGEPLDLDVANDERLLFGEISAEPLRDIEAQLAQIFVGHFAERTQEAWGDAVETTAPEDFVDSLGSFVNDMQDSIKSIVSGLELKPCAARFASLLEVLQRGDVAFGGSANVLLIEVQPPPRPPPVDHGAVT